MLGCLLLTALSHTSVKESYAVAFSSRIYFSPRSAKVSHSQLFTCNLDGSCRRQWTKGLGDVREVWWSSRNKLSYRVIFDTDQEEGALAEAWELDLRTHSKRMLKRGRSDDVDWPVQDVPANSQGANSNEALVQSGHKVLIDIAHGSMTLAGKPVDFEPGIADWLYDAKLDRLWLFSRDHSSTTGTDNRAYFLNWKSGKAVPLVTHARTADFRTDRTTYAFVSSRDTLPYDKKRTVWTSQAIVGDWKKGTRYLIAGPKSLWPDIEPFKEGEMSYQFGISLRP